jgi:hypothetical protein
MNLIELYDVLNLPNGNGKIFNAIQVPEYKNFRVAIDIDGNPILLLSVEKKINDIALKNFRLKYLQLEQNIDCRITENAKTSFEKFTVITFISTDRYLKYYFLQIAETLMKSLGNKPTQQELIETLNRFIEIFRSLSDTPTNTVQGLWAELFLIDNSNNPSTLLNYWHLIPEEKFDFNANSEKIEVKSSASFERSHIFSSEQLNPPKDTQVLIASIFVRQNSSGINIQDIVESIKAKINNEINLVIKLNYIICKTLGNSLEQSMQIKFDYQIAKDSLMFFMHQEIKKIEEINIPSEVSELHYKSNLTGVVAVKPKDLIGYTILFNSI